MSTRIIGSDEARLKLRDILDDVQAGTTEVVIERYNKPTAVVVNYAQWQAWRRQRKARLDRIRQEMDAGHYLTQEELDQELKEKGLL
ncbi:MAG TPA: type II toxin-antitoxin system Phd/YefM family antitoxin [Caldilineaceae bacterium]|nr:type II toxin-antitoxin system Phd/YefM family antitoxin [Caldilineaceae bacterium]